MIKTNAEIKLQKDGYIIRGFIGEGACGVVWEARRLSDGKIVALKTTQSRAPNVNNRTPYNQEQKKNVRDALERERRFLSRIPIETARENHILPMLDSGFHEGAPILALVHCDGPFTDIYKKRLKNGDALPFKAEDLIRWTRQIASGLATLHAKSPEKNKAVYRDLKFDNILMKDEQLYLADFGTHKILENDFTNSLGGTPEWAAPEMLIPRAVVNGETKYELTPAADLYGLGLILFSLLTGGQPKSQDEILLRVNGRKKPNPGAERDFGKVGGIKDWERAMLKKQIGRMFPAGGETLIPQSMVGLPDFRFIQETMISLIERLLSPRLDRRPTAKEVVRTAGLLQDALDPKIDQLEVRLPGGGPFHLGDRPNIAVVAIGRGLPENGQWLNLTVGGKPVSTDIRLKSRNTWSLQLPSLDAEGEIGIEVSTAVHGRLIGADQIIHVEATPEQLWGMERHAEALIRNPDRKDWLEALSARADRDSRYRLEYLSLLETVREAHPEHVDINLRYWPLRHRIEAENRDKHQKDRVQKRRRLWIAGSLAVLCIALAMFAVIRLWMPGYQGGKLSGKEIAGKENPHTTAESQAEATRERLAEEREVRERKKREEARLQAAEEERLRLERESAAEEARRRQALEEAEKAEELRRQREEEVRLQAEKEKQQREAAMGAYQNAKTLLADGKWKPAQAVLQEEAELLNRYLDDVEIKNLALLNQFFQDLEDGDTEKDKEPLGIENLEAAEKHYTQAKAKALDLPDDVKVWHIANDRHKETVKQRESLAARETFRKIMALAGAGDWKQTQTLLFEKIDLLKRGLPETDKAAAVRMETYFRGLENGDRERSRRSDRASGYEAAIEHYKKAQAIEPDLPAGLAKLGLAKGRIEDAEQRLVELRKEEEQAEAATKRKYHLRSTPMKADSDGELGYQRHLENDFQNITGETVTDRATGLMWQRHGSNEWLTYADAKRYIRQLNSDRFAGYADWRLPTVPELGSLVEEEKKDGRYIDPVFNRRQRWCWSWDTRASGGAWHVDFLFGYAFWDDLDLVIYVRAVRSGQ
jgi:serine/threonine protein kinase